MIIDLLLLLELIIINGFFALSEIAIVTAKKGKLQEMKEKENKGFLKLVKSFD